VVGYGRYDSPAELALINQIYQLSPLFQNFFQPLMKRKRLVNHPSA